MHSIRAAFCPRQFRFSLAVVALCTNLLTMSAAIADDAPQLAQQLPSSVNAIAIVRVGEILQSPRAQREDWAKTADENFLSGAGGIPSWVKNFVIGFNVRTAVPEEVWAAAVATVPTDHTIQMISQRNEMPLEMLGGLQATRGRGNNYLVGISPGVLGIWRPGVRQEVARWAGEIAAKITGPSSDYLMAATANPGQMVFAIDLDHALDPNNTQAMLEMNRQLAATSRAGLQSLLMSLKGVTLSIAVAEKTTAQVHIDFSQPVGNNGQAVKDFLLEVLQQMGASIDELDTSSVSASGNSVVLTSDFSDDSLRRMMSLINASPRLMPAKPAAPPTPSTTVTPPTSAPGRAESRAYFRAVDNYLNDLERAKRRATANSRTALWHDNFARKIDDLPTAGVDPDLLNYGSDVASKLRALGRSLQGQAMQINAHENTLVYDVDFTPGWASVNVWGGIGFGESSFNVRSNLQQVRERQAEAVIAGTDQRDQIWTMLRDQRSQVLRTMQQRFGADFPR
ncbi:hypothetical protein [Planctomicrobium piriforme]|uniref:Uncharacterized protein n=1 Tax=Planctomicrobium piriforme TaxID=1576369 RepID=A0A1I3I8E7_9PLAN|nr:hypothetical protein [Planctomicrobium piriforme]SFI44169.1 hypothetical protein SAMN05421753_10912 [Planctomicrobium piriforme]